MKEVLTRRYTRLMQEGQSLPQPSAPTICPLLRRLR